MNAAIISLNNLQKHYGTIKAVDGLNLNIPAGDIFGLLGPNGAGKSTTIRMMLSLITPTAGQVVIFGKELSKFRSQILKNVGCIIEKPDFYLYLPAINNLEIFARMSGIKPSKQLLYATLEKVGLKGREKDRVQTYSHGMKQRLGIAQTLIHDPELIILDEPTTGLDPQGIIDLRNLLLQLKHDLGKTIVLSSHILSEMEMIADSMAIINKGLTVVQGNVSELLSNEDLIVTLEVGNPEGLLQGIQTTQWKNNFIEQHQQKFLFNIAKDQIPALTKLVNSLGIDVYSIVYKRTLEDYFLKLTSDK